MFKQSTLPNSTSNSGETNTKNNNPTNNAPIVSPINHGIWGTSDPTAHKQAIEALGDWINEGCPTPK